MYTTSREPRGSVSVRPARPEDRPFVLDTANRLASFEPPPWRTPEELIEGEARTLRAFFDSPGSGAALLIAERLGERAGFAYLEVLRDYFTQEEHGHVGIVAVAAHAEGTGAGAAVSYTHLTLPTKRIV